MYKPVWACYCSLPLFELGQTDINLTYQASGQITSRPLTDPTPDLLSSGRKSSGLASLFRFQGSLDLSRRFFTLWQGDPLPATPLKDYAIPPQTARTVSGIKHRDCEGLLLTIRMIVLQEILSARVAISGQVGHLSRNLFDLHPVQSWLFHPGR